MRSLRVILIAAIALSAVAACGETKDEAYIYKGGSLSTDGITVGSWGSGKAVESKKKILTGSNSIEISTQGYYAGGRIDFSKPVTLFSKKPDSSRYLVFTVFFDDVKSVDPAAGTGYSFDVEPYTVPRVSNVRFVFEAEDGSSISVEEPTGQLDPDDNWVRIAVPLAKFHLAEEATDFSVKRLLVFSDIANTFYIGEIKLVTDTSQIKVDAIGSQTVAIQDNVFIVAQAEGGVSNLKYSWDFDSSNGIQEEQTDMVAHYVYTRGGDYTITLTVSDVDGIKQPVQTTGKFSVIE
ncbi:MAG: PKD domain-containing protein [Armatimonadota bacterium]|nr:PKD domain-containing protein [bacterium]